jgi:peptide/nickel transport system substrate-binding protein
VKRTIIVVLVAGVLMVAQASGCKRGGRKIAPPVLRAVPQADYKPVIGKFGGRMVQSTLGPPKSFNPITAGETSTTEYTGFIFLGLTRTNAWDSRVEPELALSWTPDESGKVWTVKLRPNVTWSDGVPFTADDVVFTYDTIYDERWTCSMRDIITGPENEKWKVEKVDDLTVRFTLFDRNAIFPELIGEGIIPKHKFEPLVTKGKFNEELGTDVDPATLVGTGPFLLSKYETGSRVYMKRNPRYYKTDAQGRRLPYLDEIVTLIVPDQDVDILKFRQGETDVTGIRGADYPMMSSPQTGVDYTIYKLGPAMGELFLVFNQNTGKDKDGKPYVEPHKLAWFRDKRFRQAVSHAINRQFIIESIMSGLGYPQYSPMIPESGFYFANPNVRQYEYDPEKAKALLREAGLEDRNGDGILEDAQGRQVSFNLTTNSENKVREKMSEAIRKDLETIGMRVNYRSMAFNTIITKLDYTFDWEACIMGLTGGPEPGWGGNVWKSSGRLHMWFPRQEKPSTPWEAEIDKLWAEGLAELNPEKRRAIYWRWQELVAEDQPFIYTALAERLTVLRDKFGNVFPAPIGGVLHNIEEVYLK